MRALALFLLMSSFCCFLDANPTSKQDTTPLAIHFGPGPGDREIAENDTPLAIHFGPGPGDREIAEEEEVAKTNTTNVSR